MEESKPYRIIIKNIALVVVIGVSIWLLMPTKEDREKKAQRNAPKMDASGEVVNVKHELRFCPGFYMPGVAPGGMGEPIEAFDILVEKFEALYPDTKITAVKVPGTPEYQVTQLSSEQAPDVMMLNVEDVWPNVDKDWYIPLDDYLNKPNPFVAEGELGSEKWWDMFKYQGISRGKAGPNGRYWCISFDMIETGIYYNKDLFDQMGYEVPTTWEEFEVILKGFQAKPDYLIDSHGEEIDPDDVVPFSIALNPYADWGVDLFFDQLYADILPGIDLEKDPQREVYLEGYLDWFELCFLNEKGFFTRYDPRWREVWRLLKEFRSYASSDIASTDILRAFVTEKSPMVWLSSNITYRFVGDPSIKFNWGVFYMPAFTPETSPMITETRPMCVIGGAGTQFSVTNSAIKDTDKSLPFEQRIAESERLERVMQFLQFLTAPENYEMLVNERPIMMPNINGVPVLPSLKPFETILERRYTTTKWTATYDLKFVEIFRRMLGLYLDGNIEDEELYDWYEGNLMGACSSFIRKKNYDGQMLEAGWLELAPMRADMPYLPEVPAE